MADGQADVAEMVRRIVERFRPEKVILFGSRARGAASPESDVDLLVVMRPRTTRRRQAAEIDLALADRRLPLDLLVVTPEDLERDRDQSGTLLCPALREGKVLYERPA